jgi:hypothetical protein
MQQYDLTARENLVAADNQQGRPGREIEREPSTTTCTAPKKQRKHKDTVGYHWSDSQERWVRTIKGGLAHCSDCNQWKPINDFASIRGKPYSYCKNCQRLHKAMSRYKITRDEAEKYYAARTCECCGCEFEKQTHKHIHHLGDKVIGVICLCCNHTLRDESPEHLRRLECCIRFAKQRVKI